MGRHLHRDGTIHDKAVRPFARLPKDRTIARLHDDVHVAPRRPERTASDGYAVGEHLKGDDGRSIGQRIGNHNLAVRTLRYSRFAGYYWIGGKCGCRKENNRRHIEKRFHMSRSFLTAHPGNQHNRPTDIRCSCHLKRLGNSPRDRRCKRGRMHACSLRRG